MLSYCFSNIVSFLALHINILRMFEYIDLGLRIWKLYASKFKLDKQYQSSTHIINSKYWKVIQCHNAEITRVHSKWRLSSVSYYSWSPKLLTKFIILCQGFWEIIFILALVTLQWVYLCWQYMVQRFTRPHGTSIHSIGLWKN